MNIAIAITAILSASALIQPAAGQSASSVVSAQEDNQTFIRQAFQRWAAGEDDFFDLLADDVTWHITGFDPAIARTYHSREALRDGAVRPLAARLVESLRPTVRQVWSDGDDVIVHWDGTARVYDGSRYQNTYLWILTVKDRRIVAVTAFLDNAVFKAVLTKPAPGSGASGAE